MQCKSFNIIFPYNEIDWNKASNPDDYDLKFIVDYGDRKVETQNYFDIFSLIRSPEFIFGPENRKSHITGCGATGAMRLLINREPNNNLNIRINPRYFNISYIPLERIDTIERFIKEYSEIDGYDYLKGWKEILNSRTILKSAGGSREDFLEISVCRAPIAFEISGIDFINEIIEFQKGLLQLKSIPHKKVEDWFNKILIINSKILESFNKQPTDD